MREVKFGHRWPDSEGGEDIDSANYTAYAIGSKGDDARLLRVYHTDSAKRLLELLPDEALALARFIADVFGEEAE